VARCDRVSPLRRAVGAHKCIWAIRAPEVMQGLSRLGCAGAAHRSSRHRSWSARTERNLECGGPRRTMVDSRPTRVN
jgi:hypothetical protein